MELQAKQQNWLDGYLGYFGSLIGELPLFSRSQHQQNYDRISAVGLDNSCQMKYN
jgi:hypothetical protein